jgi:parvulin-like peptidyl-prolyl isomerase
MVLGYLNTFVRRGVKRRARSEDRFANISSLFVLCTLRSSHFALRSSLFVFSFFLISCSKKADEGPALARVGDKVISRGAYEQRLKDLLMLTPLDNARMRNALLEAMINEQAMLIEADRLGWREAEDFKHYSESVKVDAILEVYREAMADRRTVVQESDVQLAFALAHEQAAARHLYAPTLEQANALYEKLQGGATFDELAPQVFKDYRLASSGGHLGYFKWEDMDPTFSAVAQGLKKGEISKPVRTKFGYSIIQLEDRKRVPLLTETQYLQQRKKLRWVVEHRKRAAEIQKLDAETLDLLKIEFNDETVSRLFDEITKARSDSTWRAESANGHSSLDANSVMATVAGKKWTLHDFRERVVFTSARQRGKVQSQEDLKNFISGLALRDEYLRRAKSDGFDKNPKVSHLVRTKEERFLLDNMQQLLTAPVRVPIDSLRAQFAARPQDYIHPAKARLREITVADHEQASFILQRLRRGADFQGMARQYSIRKWSAERGGEVGYVTKADLGTLGNDIFKLKTGEIGGPYQQQDYFSIVQVLERAPERNKTFEEARAEIEEVLLPTFKQRALQEQIRNLRQPLTIQVDQQIFQEVKSPL